MSEDMEKIMETEQTQQPKSKLIPLNIVAISGDSDTKTEYRLSYSQIAFLTEEQWPIFTMRFNDLVTTINQMAKDNSREKPTA